MHIRRTIYIVISIIAVIISFTIQPVNTENVSVYLDNVPVEVTKEICELRKVDIQKFIDNADTIISYSDEEREGYNKLMLAYSPVVLLASSNAIDKAQSLKSYSAGDNEIYKISLAKFVKEYNKATDDTWIDNVGFSSKYSKDIKVYVPSVDSPYRKAVVDALITACIADGETLESATNQINMFMSKCEQEFDVQSIAWALDRSYDKMLIAPELFRITETKPLYDNNTAQIEMYVYIRNDLDIEQVLDKLLGNGVFRRGILSEMHYRKDDHQVLGEYDDFSSYGYGIAKQFNSCGKTDYSKELGESYWMKDLETVQISDISISNDLRH